MPISDSPNTLIIWQPPDNHSSHSFRLTATTSTSFHTSPSATCYRLSMFHHQLWSFVHPVNFWSPLKYLKLSLLVFVELSKSGRVYRIWRRRTSGWSQRRKDGFEYFVRSSKEVFMKVVRSEALGRIDSGWIEALNLLNCGGWRHDAEEWKQISFDSGCSMRLTDGTILESSVLTLLYWPLLYLIGDDNKKSKKKGIEPR